MGPMSRFINASAALLIGVSTATTVLAGPPCCNITGINAKGIVTAKDRQTGRSFRFQVKDKSILQGLHVGQNVWADFASNAVALVDNGAPCCNVIPPQDARGPVTAAPTDGVRGTVASAPGAPCCEIVPNAALGGHMGQLVVGFPQGADVGMSIVNVYKADGQTKLQGGIGNQTWQLAPGTYAVEISGVRIPKVQVKAGADTRVRVGVLQVKAGSNTIADVLDASGRKLDGHMGGFAMGLPAGTYGVRVNGQTQPVQVRAGTTTSY